jgi:hypothetical protein
MNFASLVALLAILAVIAVGLSRIRYPRAPYIVAGAIVGLYVIGISSFGIWAATCWDCEGSLGETRADFYYATFIFLSLAAITLLAGVWMGARLMTMLQRLRRTWRELRGTPHNVPNEAPSEEKRDAVKH